MEELLIILLTIVCVFLFVLLMVGRLSLFKRKSKSEDVSIVDDQVDRITLSEDGSMIEVRLFHTDEGEVRLTNQMLLLMDQANLVALNQDLTDEAISRGLEVSIRDDIVTGDTIVRWRPARSGRVHEG